MLKKCKSNPCQRLAQCSHDKCVYCCNKSHPLRDYSSRPHSPGKYKGHYALGAEIELIGDRLRRVGFTCHDGSLSTPDGENLENGGEIKLVGHCCRMPARVANKCELARSLGAYANKTCGFHIHMDRRDIEQSRVDEMMQWFNAHESWFFALVPKRRRDGAYTRKLFTLRGTHYTWVNSRETTVELRIHPGTANPSKAYAWTLYCASLVHHLHSGMSWHTHHPLDLAPKISHQYLEERLNHDGVLEDFSLPPKVYEETQVGIFTPQVIREEM